MKSYRQRPLNDRIKTVQTATKNMLARPPLVVKLAKKEYNAAALNEGRALADTADAAIVESGNLLGDKKAATDHAGRCLKAAHAVTAVFAKLSRAIFVDQPDVLAILGLDATLPKARNAYITAAKQMFNSSHYTNAMKTKLDKNEWTSTELSEARGKIAELEAALIAQVQCKADYETGTDTQRKAIKAMDKWMAMFIKVARLVFADEPQELERLNVTTRSTPTKKQRAARVARKQLKLKLKLTKAA